MLLCTLFLDIVTVTLAPTADVHGTAIELGEIAVVAGASAPDILELQAIEIGYSPSPGYTRMLFAERVAETVRRSRPDLEFVFNGAPNCRVSPLTQVIPRERVERAARDVLESAVTGDRVSLTLRQVLEDVIVPLGNEEPLVRGVLNTPDVRSGIQSVTVRIELEGRVHATRQVMFDVQRWQTVAVLRRSIASGAIITPDLIDMRDVLIAPNQREAALTSDMLIGSIAARNIEQGRALTRVDVHRPMVVEARSAVIVEVRHGQISARAAAIALEDGAGGDRIRVKILDSGREMHAVVHSRDVVVIDIGPARKIG